MIPAFGLSDEQAKQLREAGWNETPGGNWVHDDGEFVRVLVPYSAWRCMLGMKADKERRRDP